MNSDLTDLLNILNARKVHYLVVGGYAVMKYTEPRYTKALDIWLEASEENAIAVFSALRAFGAPLTNLSPASFSPEGSIYQMGRPPARVDVLTSIDGVSFSDAWVNRVDTDLGGVPTKVNSRQDLVLHKRALGRPQYLLDLHNLMESERVSETATGVRKPKKADRPKKPPH
jgi:hypothetical protein